MMIMGDSMQYYRKMWGMCWSLLKDLVQVLLIANISQDKDAQEKQTKEDQSTSCPPVVNSGKTSLQEKSQINTSVSFVLGDLPAANQ